MKNILLLIIFPLIAGCQTKEYQELINKVPKYNKVDYDKEFFFEFSIYENANTKNINLPKAKIDTIKKYPWETSESEKRIAELANQIQKTITATTDAPSNYNKEPSSTICFYSLVNNFFTTQQLAEFKKTGSITTQKTVLNYIKATIKSYDLTNEKNEKIKLRSDVLGLVGGGFQKKKWKIA